MDINMPIFPKTQLFLSVTIRSGFSRNEIVVSLDLDQSRVRAHSTVSCIKALSSVA